MRTRKKQLTRQAVKEIIELLGKGETGCSIANRYNVHESTVSYIKNGITWKDINRKDMKQKLTENQEKEIQHQISIGEKIADIAAEYGVSISKVYSLKYDMMEKR